MSKKILIVDDNEDLRQEICDFLDQFEVLEAGSGEEALRMLRRAHNIGLLILDVMMPGLSGLDVLEEIKKTDPQVSVIILTGHSSKDVAIDALKAHADDYIEKPIDIRRFQETVEKWMAVQNKDPDMASLDLPGKMQQLKKFIERNCFKKINLSDAANAVRLSKKYLSRVFKEQMGFGFNEYKLKVKIEKSKELLTKYGFTVNQIALKLGYENAESFIRQFKKIAGSTPTDYRNKIKTKRVSGKRVSLARK